MRHDVKFVAARSNLLVSSFKEILAHDIVDVLVPGRERPLQSNLHSLVLTLSARLSQYCSLSRVQGNDDVSRSSDFSCDEDDNGKLLSSKPLPLYLIAITIEDIFSWFSCMV